jgi:fatty-acyl-CoA synthase
MPFSYHGDPAKTAAAQHPEHPTWSAIGDVGRVDDDGYLYLTDRTAFMIISGGVNVYPQEAEDVLVMHPAVADVAVIGIPDDDLGEAVLGVVQPVEGVEPSADLAADLIGFARERLAGYKVPRRIEFMAELPRSAAGKLVKRRLTEVYR